MAKLILLDHSLKGDAGHHGEYDSNLLQAAEQRGWQITLATHAAYQAPDDIPASWQLLPVFTVDAYNDFAIYSGGDEQLRELDAALPGLRDHGKSAWVQLLRALSDRRLSWAGLREAWNQRRRTRKRRRAIESFVRECEWVFRQAPVDAGDVVFVPTLTEFDLERLVAFWTANPISRDCSWHLQFHFNFLAGREPDYQRQQAGLAAMRRQFAALFAQVPEHSIFLYATTKQLADQFDQLQVGDFQALPYPARKDLSVRADARADQPLRVVCAGGIRPEKGCHQLAAVIEDLWGGFFASGRLQLCLQTDQENFHLPLPNGRAAQVVAGLADRAAPAEEVVCVRGPLAAEDYSRFIQSADVGLFLYNSERYYTRCSGVLVEMLAAGIPVIVPAACWLSAQIAESIYVHLDALMANLPVVASYSTDAPARSAFDDLKSRLVCDLPRPAPATDLVLSLRCQEGLPPGVYPRLVAEQFDQAGGSIRVFKTILEPRREGGAMSAIVHLQPAAANIRLTLENPFDKCQILPRGAEARFLQAPGGRCPAGAVGLIAADHWQLGELFADLTHHIGHYRQTAASFAKQWAQAHRPERTLEILEARLRAARPVNRAPCARPAA